MYSTFPPALRGGKSDVMNNAVAWIIRVDLAIRKPFYDVVPRQNAIGQCFHRFAVEALVVESGRS
jgi:hypothetical protein